MWERQRKKTELFFPNLALFGPWPWEQSGCAGTRVRGRGKLSTRGGALPYPPTRDLGSGLLRVALKHDDGRMTLGATGG